MSRPPNGSELGPSLPMHSNIDQVPTSAGSAMTVNPGFSQRNGIAGGGSSWADQFDKHVEQESSAIDLGVISSAKQATGTDGKSSTATSLGEPQTQSTFIGDDDSITESVKPVQLRIRGNIGRSAQTRNATSPSGANVDEQCGYLGTVSPLQQKNEVNGGKHPTNSFWETHTIPGNVDSIHPVQARKRRWQYKIFRLKGQLRLFVAAIFLVMHFLIRKQDQKLIQIEYNVPLRLPSKAPVPAALPECTKEASVWPKPDTLSGTKYASALKVEQILAYLISKLNEVGAPMTIMFGTLLREYRNGTDGPCLQPDYNDKDFDIAVFPYHFHYITSLEQEIYEKFGWVFWISDIRRRRLFTATIQPENPAGDFMQIDIYGFHCSESNDLVFFPWDMVTIEKNALLPVQKHKLILSQDDDAGDSETNNTTMELIFGSPCFYMPYNTPCLLHNIYGSDYMTPKSGITSQAKWGKDNGRPAFYNPKCNHTLTQLQEDELNRQLMYC